MPIPLLWITSGQRFDFDDLVLWQGCGRRAFATAAKHVDTIVLGPHASADFPAELRPFIAPALTLRKQCDFSDRVTDDLGRAWVQADPHVVYVRNPVSRLVFDPNRAPPVNPIGDLREFHARLARQRAGENVSFTGIDAVRPITFGGEDVLPEPPSPQAWQVLGDTLAEVAARTVQIYRACCDEVLQTVLAQRDRAAPLRVISLHDTMNTKMRSDGAIVVERPATDRLPAWTNLGNRGDTRGDAQDEPVTLAGTELRRMAAAWADAFGLTGAARQEHILLNRPYKGAFETIYYGERLRELQRPCVGALQVEFLREALLGPLAVAQLHAAGEGWPEPDPGHLEGIAAALARAGRELRTR